MQKEGKSGKSIEQHPTKNHLTWLVLLVLQRTSGTICSLYRPLRSLLPSFPKPSHYYFIRVLRLRFFETPSH